MRQKATVVVDLQFGSTGKGAVAGYLAEVMLQPDVVVTAWSANAGHTYIDLNGRKYVHCMLANGIVSPNLRHVLIGPGSQIDPVKLWAEIQECQDLISQGGVRIHIHPHACVIQNRHRLEEAGSMTKIGSTKKGCGAAMAEKIRRHADQPIVAKDVLCSAKYGDPAALNKFGQACHHLADYITAQAEYDRILDEAEEVLVEGAQGYSLGINSGFYPYCTSRECTAPQVLVDCRVPPGMVKNVVGVARTYPIRVANRFDDGKQVGWSGPCYPDQEEIDWCDIDQQPELTTVTKLPRRIFSWSNQQVAEALRMNGCTHAVLTFVDYLHHLPMDQQDGALDEREAAFLHHDVELLALGTGPKADDMIVQGEIS